MFSALFAPMIAASVVADPDGVVSTDALHTVVVNGSVAQVVAWLPDAAATVEFKVTGTQDLADRIRKNGLETDDLVVADVCHAPTAAAVLKAAPEFSALLPCRIAVQRSGDKTVVRTARPIALAKMIGAPAPVAEAAADVDAKIMRILAAVAKRSKEEAEKPSGQQ